jgi:non-heme chloroperoxidase
MPSARLRPSEIQREATDDFRGDLPRIDVPTLVMHGTADRILPFEATAARLRDERLIADLTVVEVADGPHNIGWTYPEEVNTALLDFLDGESADRAPTPA